MDQKKLAWLAESIIYRVRNFPDQAIRHLFQALETIERKYDLYEPLSDEDRLAIDRSRADMKAGRFVTQKEFFADILKSYDADADGKDAFLDAVSRVKKLPGENQEEIADVIFALLDTPRFDIPPPPEKS